MVSIRPKIDARRGRTVMQKGKYGLMSRRRVDTKNMVPRGRSLAHLYKRTVGTLLRRIYRSTEINSLVSYDNPVGNLQHLFGDRGIVSRVGWRWDVRNLLPSCSLIQSHHVKSMLGSTPTRFQRGQKRIWGDDIFPFKRVIGDPRPSRIKYKTCDSHERNGQSKSGWVMELEPRVQRTIQAPGPASSLLEL